MAVVEGAELVVRALKAEGVECLWTLSGGHIMGIYEYCDKAGIRIVDARHEQAAGHMAEGWAKVTSKPGVCAVTAGPGVTDVISAVANAYHSASPMVVLGGRAPLREWDIGALQDMEQVGLMSSVTKWSKVCLETRRLPEYVSLAFRQAGSGKPGPAYLDIPLDVLHGKVEEKEVFSPGKSEVARPQGEATAVRKAVSLLLQAERPLVIAGGGAFWAQAGNELKEFIETARLPLLTNSAARGIVPDDHELCFGAPSPFSGRGGGWALRQADVILVVGDRFNYILGYGRPGFMNRQAKVIQVDIDPLEIGRNRAVEIGIAGDAKAVLQQMTSEMSRAPHNQQWLQSLRQADREAQEKLEPLQNSDREPIHPLRLAKEVFSFLDRDAVWVTDGGDSASFAQQVARAYLPGHSLGAGPLALLGVGIPYALAAKVALPQKQVAVFQGDGSFGFNGMEMDTAVRLHLPIVVIICNDSAWGMVKHWQEIRYGKERTPASELGGEGKITRYDRMVAGLGGYGELVEKAKDIRPALERAFASGLPACLNVRVDPTAVSEVTQAMAASLLRRLS